MDPAMNAMAILLTGAGAPIASGPATKGAGAADAEGMAWDEAEGFGAVMDDFMRPALSPDPSPDPFSALSSDTSSDPTPVARDNILTEAGQIAMDPPPPQAHAPGGPDQIPLAPSAPADDLALAINGDGATDGMPVPSKRNVPLSQVDGGSRDKGSADPDFVALPVSRPASRGQSDDQMRASRVPETAAPKVAKTNPTGAGSPDPNTPRNQPGFFPTPKSTQTPDRSQAPTKGQVSGVQPIAHDKVTPTDLPPGPAHPTDRVGVGGLSGEDPAPSPLPDSHARRMVGGTEARPGDAPIAKEGSVRSDSSKPTPAATHSQGVANRPAPVASSPASADAPNRTIPPDRAVVAAPADQPIHHRLLGHNAMPRPTWATESSPLPRAAKPSAPLQGARVSNSATGLVTAASFVTMEASAPLAEPAPELAAPDVQGPRGAPTPGAGPRFDFAGTQGTAIQIARQIAAISPNIAADRPVEIMLEPAELGRVRMALSPVDSSLSLLITAERPETLDLMRRHAEHLIRELAGSGFDDVSLSFGTSDPNSSQAGAEDKDSTGEDSVQPQQGAVAVHVGKAAQGPNTADANLDLRL